MMDASSSEEDGRSSCEKFLLKLPSPAETTPRKKITTKKSPPKVPSKTLKRADDGHKDKRKVSRRLKLDDDEPSTSGRHDGDESRNSYHSGEGGGSSGKWLDKITPKKGWRCMLIEDLGVVRRTCEMCEREQIRYVHTVIHPKKDLELKVGCICSGHLSGDSRLAKERQAKLEQRCQRRENFPNLKTWKLSKNDRNYIIFQRKGKKYWVVITRPGVQYSAMIEDKSGDDGKLFINKFCNTKSEAQLAAFDHLFPQKLEFEEGKEDPSFDFGYKEKL